MLKSHLERSLTSMASKTALPNILKIVWNQCISSKDWWKIWIGARDCKKTKLPQQWGVTDYIFDFLLLNTQCTTNPTIVYPFKMKYGWKGYFPNLLEITLLHPIFVHWVRDFKFWLLAYLLELLKFDKYWINLILHISYFFASRNPQKSNYKMFT